MITFFIILIICAIIGFFICGNDGGYGFELEGAFLGIILGAFVGVIPAVIIAFIVGSRFPAHFVLIEKRNLVALQDNLSSSGRFFLGSGSVNEEQRYYYFYDLGNGGYKADYERADTSVVFEDEQKKPYLNKYTWLFVNPEHQKWGFTFNLRDSEFHIPKGSLLRNYQLDLK